MFVHNYVNYNEYLNINEKYILDNNKIILYNNSIYNNIHYSNIIIKSELCKIIRYDENLIIERAKILLRQKKREQNIVNIIERK